MIRARSPGRRAVSDRDDPAGACAPAPPDRAVLREAALAHLARFGTTRQGLEQVLLRRVARWRGRAQAAGGEDTAETARGLDAICAEIAQEMVRLGAVDDAAFARARTRRLVRTGRSSRAIAAHLAAKGVGADIAAQALRGEEETGDTAFASSVGAAAPLGQADGATDGAPGGVVGSAYDYRRGLDAAERELCAALVLARKRRLGPFASPAAQDETARSADSMAADPMTDHAADTSWDDETPPDARQGSRGFQAGGGMGAAHRALGVLARAGFARDTAARALDMTREEAEEWLERLKAES